MKKIFMICFLVLPFFANAQDTTESTTSVFDKKQKMDNEGVELYSSNTEMKLYKKLGVGLSLGGSSGILGINAEVNLDSNEAMVVGLGTGPSYGTFGIGWKHNFEGAYLSPYTKLAYSKWYSSSGNSASDSDVLKRIFSESELKSGRFSADFLIAGAGIEYNQLEGELSGVNLFGEIVLMDEISKSTVIPAGGIGITYYY